MHKHVCMYMYLYVCVCVYVCVYVRYVMHMCMHMCMHMYMYMYMYMYVYMYMHMHMHMYMYMHLYMHMYSICICMCICICIYTNTHTHTHRPDAWSVEEDAFLWRRQEKWVRSGELWRHWPRDSACQLVFTVLRSCFVVGWMLCFHLVLNSSLLYTGLPTTTILRTDPHSCNTSISSARLSTEILWRCRCLEVSNGRATRCWRSQTARTHSHSNNTMKEDITVVLPRPGVCRQQECHNTSRSVLTKF